ncbi:MAG: type IV pilus assembly protein PilM [Oscillatoriaceae bacterium SKW80]|nr:type IV pilus assembly protein PilM [Oscillatoriaceae bacterium SKYG93]MCX8122286.1 type IV pilus assembly protein PilM [Oscillatoriaceae bacterium SKW80]MDW8452501.1 type IV pilus assembly protein PilM [Oscillatoriaceae cyanobacterium SKYGB_i_bin93]HIK29653.1 type IV pilus assembly protein PilM [Oscillatoriaceae cyanobacterium M7585_C2015_266]
MVNLLKNLFAKKKQGLGIELSPDRINIVQLCKQGQGYKLENFVTVEVPENVFQEGQIADAPQIAELIRQALADNKIKIRNVATAIPGREVVSRLIPVPAELNDQELRDYMNQEAGLYLPFPREEADVDFQKLGLFVDEDGIEKVQVLLVATRKEIIDTYINIFKEAELAIDVIEVTSFALLRTIREQLQQFTPQEAAVLADIEFDSTELAIVVDGIPQFSRTIPIGTFHIQSALAKAMNLPPSRNTDLLAGMTIPVTPVDTSGGLGATSLGNENPGAAAMLKVLGELADEIRRSLDFYLNQSENLEVAQMLLAGPGAALGQIDEFFMQRLSLPTSGIDPIESLSLEVNEEISPVQRTGLGVVLGLALREV